MTIRIFNGKFDDVLSVEVNVVMLYSADWASLSIIILVDICTYLPVSVSSIRSIKLAVLIAW